MFAWLLIDTYRKSKLPFLYLLLGLVCAERILKISYMSLAIHANFTGLSIEETSNWMIAGRTVNSAAGLFYLLAHWLFSWRYLVVSQTIWHTV